MKIFGDLNPSPKIQTVVGMEGGEGVCFGGMVGEILKAVGSASVSKAKRLRGCLAWTQQAFPRALHCACPH